MGLPDHQDFQVYPARREMPELLETKVPQECQDLSDSTDCLEVREKRDVLALQEMMALLEAEENGVKQGLQERQGFLDPPV